MNAYADHAADYGLETARADDVALDTAGSISLMQSKSVMAPLIRNAWYVVARRADVGRTLRAIKVLGTPLVLYRTEGGDPVVLDDRCAHRRFPLSKSRLIGDTIQCRYHGFTYGSDGACVHVPGAAGIPRFGVRRFPAVERGPWLWAWMGDADRANPNEIWLPEHVGEVDAVDGYVFDAGNYMLSMENLLDVTHVHFLHGDVGDIALAELDFAISKPRSIPAPKHGVAFEKHIPTIPTGIFGAWCGEDPARLVRQVLTVNQYGPALNQGRVEQFALSDDEPPVRPARVTMTHCFTPADETSTHHFFENAFSAPLTVSKEYALQVAQDQVFPEDQEACALIQDYINGDDRAGQVEVGVPTDRFGIRMRQILRDMARAEQS